MPLIYSTETPDWLVTIELLEKQMGFVVGLEDRKGLRIGLLIKGPPPSVATHIAGNEDVIRLLTWVSQCLWWGDDTEWPRYRVSVFPSAEVPPGATGAAAFEVCDPEGGRREIILLESSSRPFNPRSVLDDVFLFFASEWERYVRPQIS